MIELDPYRNAKKGEVVGSVSAIALGLLADLGFYLSGDFTESIVRNHFAFYPISEAIAPYPSWLGLVIPLGLGFVGGVVGRRIGKRLDNMNRR